MSYKLYCTVQAQSMVASNYKYVIDCQLTKQPNAEILSLWNTLTSMTSTFSEVYMQSSYRLLETKAYLLVFCLQTGFKL